MKRDDMVLQLSAKLQKNIHRMKSQTHTPKILCDNLALIVLNEIERTGMLPPAYTCVNENNKKSTPYGSCKLYEWEPDEYEV